MTPPGLRLEPLWASTYRADGPAPLDDVTMPAVEHWDDDLVRRLSAARTDHVLHLVAPPLGAGPGAGRDRLDAWRSAGVVDVATRPALYDWRWTQAGRSVRGVAGAVALPAGERMRAHESVRPDIVSSRAAALARAGVQAEPIVVLHMGEPLVAASSPVLDLSRRGERHRIGTVAESDQISAVQEALATAAAPVVADGHHRLVALDRLLAEGAPGQAMSHALVLVVDVARSDLGVRGIHRVVPRLDRERVAAATAASSSGQLVSIRNGREDDYLQSAEAGHLRYVLADAGGVLGLDQPVDPTRSPAAAICHLHGALLPAWGVAETEVAYVHDWAEARAEAKTLDGLAVATSAPDLDDVIAAAESGRLLPHKATSIGPKPRIGLLLFDGRSVSRVG